MAYAEITPDKKKKFHKRYRVWFVYNGHKVPLTRMSWGYRGIFAIRPWSRSGTKTIKVTAGIYGKRHRRYYKIKTGKTKFYVQKGSMDLGRYSNKNYLRRHPKVIKFIRENRRKRNRALARFSPDILTAHISHPRDIHRITSPFYVKRITYRYIIRKRRKIYKKPWMSRHSGVDLWGRTGYPIYALARGRVVIAENMYYQGKYTIIDHGRGIFSDYMHQSKILVHRNQIVNAGQLIGRVGATGMVTGPHLHLGLRIRGVKVSPLSMLSLPIRD